MMITRLSDFKILRESSSKQKSIEDALIDLERCPSVKFWFQPEFKSETAKYPQKGQPNSFLKLNKNGTFTGGFKWSSEDIVAYDTKGDIVGSLSMAVDGNSKGAFKIVVRDDIRRTGWGKKLLDEAENSGIDIISNIRNNSFSSSGRDLLRNWLNDKLKDSKLLKESKLVPRNLEGRADELIKLNKKLLQQEVIDGDVTIDHSWNFLHEEDIKSNVKQIHGDVTIEHNFGYIPKWLKNVEILGSFICSDNKLISLKNCPQQIRYDFDCSFNKLTSLEGCPKIVRGDFYCNDNLLTSLNGAPERISDDFNCSRNKLVSLDGFPKFIGKDFYCLDNNQVQESDIPGDVEIMGHTHFNVFKRFFKESKLVPRNLDSRRQKLITNHLRMLQDEVLNIDDGSTLIIDDTWNFTKEQVKTLQINTRVLIRGIDYIPAWLENVVIMGTFDCSGINLKSLKGCPRIINGNFKCYANKLTSLEHGPQHVMADYDCHMNLITSLEGCPDEVNTFSCGGNELINFEGCPKLIIGNLLCSDNWGKKLTTEDLPEGTVIRGKFYNY